MVTLTAKMISWLSLGLLIVPSFCFLAGIGNLETLKTLMLVATVVWFVTAGFNLIKDEHA